ncbi:MAG: efflux RND transporter periplasmic adaptor subunit [Chlorobi bacterium]|nr:efflux RND transporter periplasmic adaptor subunit [Chlorobiota bacterium]
MDKKLKYILIGGIIVLAGLTWWTLKGQGAKRARGIGVETEKITTRTLTETVEAPGTVRPEKEVKISSEVSGEIVELPVKEGQRVQKGQLIVRINPDLYRSAYERASAALALARASLERQRARLRLAEAEYKRNRTLFDKGIIARADLDRSKAEYEAALADFRSASYQVESARAGVKEARDNLKRTEIYAPLGGTVTRLGVEKGERVVGTKQMAGTEIMRIAALERMEVVAEVNENDIVKVHRGDSAEVEVDAYPGRIFRGVVREIGHSADVKTLSPDQAVNYTVKVSLLPESYADLKKEHPGPVFRPGMTAHVRILTDQKENVPAVPVGAVTLREDSAGTSREAVFLFRDGRALRRFVETGIQDETHIEIRKGVKPGDEIITGPYETVQKTLKDSMAVYKIDRSS